ncbi:MAG TPA: energy transducer TonB [Candidatus Acidoferrum sp.]
MGDSFFRALSSSARDSWLQRIRENCRQAFAPARIFPSSANGAPIHLINWRRAPDLGSSRTISLVAHLILITGIFLVHIERSTPPNDVVGVEKALRGVRTFSPLPAHVFGKPSLGMKSGGGENDPRPAKHGLLAPGSSIPLLPPRREVNPSPEVPVISSVLDPHASPFPVPVSNLGLPWMKDNADSAGPGKDHGFGSGKKGGMGDDNGPGAGQGDSYKDGYANVATLPTCVYCPDPQYTEEAREAKLQGQVALRVLVGADGRASQIQIVHGIGMGLDDRAVQSVRSWKFAPARDGARRIVPSWITIEIIFQLI